MGNVIESFASGVGKALGSLFSAPLDFLSGKSCSSICGSTWDFICYIEHFCVASLFKLGLIILVFYTALFFVYLSYKLRIFHCICQTLCKASRACFAICFHIWRNICHCLCHKFLSPRRKPHRRMNSKHAARDIAYTESSRTDDSRCQESIEESSCHSSVGSQIDASRRSMTSHRWREHQRSHLRRSLKPRNHRVQVEISSLGRKHCRHRRRDHLVSNVHHVRVTHTSKFANKRKNRSDNNKNAVHRGEGL